MAYRLAGRYRTTREPLDDLRQVAAYGLLKALGRFDVSRDRDFAGYAIPTILGELRRHFRDFGWAVHVPRSLQDLALKVDLARRKLEGPHAPPTAAQIAQYLEVSVEDVTEALLVCDAHYTASLDVPTDEDEVSILDRRLGRVDPGFVRVEISTDIERAARMLGEQERVMLRLRFEDDLAQCQIANVLNVSQMHVSRTMRRVLRTLESELGLGDQVVSPG